MNVLISSVSKKVPLIKAVKKALQAIDKKALVFGGDSDKNCVGAYFTDGFWHMPKLTSLKKEAVLTWCKENKISTIIPTRDGELLFWSKIQKFLLINGIHVMVSSEASLKTCLDKEKFFNFLCANDFPYIPTSSNISTISAKTFVVKEKVGAGSSHIGLNLTKNEAKAHAQALKNPVFQPFIKGEEYSVDLFIESRGRVKGCIARKRLLVASGESQITETEKNPFLEELCEKIALKLDLRGHVLFQAIKLKPKEYLLIECNARFGGASTLSVEAGLDSFSWFFQEALNQELPAFKRAQNEIKMVRYATDCYLHL